MHSTPLMYSHHSIHGCHCLNYETASVFHSCPDQVHPPMFCVLTVWLLGVYCMATGRKLTMATLFESKLKCFNLFFLSQKML